MFSKGCKVLLRKKVPHERGMFGEIWSVQGYQVCHPLLKSSSLVKALGILERLQPKTSLPCKDVEPRQGRAGHIRAMNYGPLGARSGDCQALFGLARVPRLLWVGSLGTTLGAFVAG